MVLAMDHRLALFLYVLLLLATAVPVAIAWLLLLPPERELFASSHEKPSGNERDIFAVFLLVNITLSLLLRIPGIDADVLAVLLARWISPEWANHVVSVGLIWFGFIGGLAAAYSLIRKNALRWPLVFGGAFMLLLSLLAATLSSAIRAAE
jgi:hypothetical protein